MLPAIWHVQFILTLRFSLEFIEKLEQRIRHSSSHLCVGLDPDIDKIPDHLPKTIDGLLEFNRQIINATKDYVCAYKPNIAFFEVLGSDGWKLLEEILSFIPDDVITIADAKRGDIGNTALQYAKTFFETFDFDAITVNPYMGLDTLEPFTSYRNKGTIVLVLTSNPGSKDFQQIDLHSEKLFERVARLVNELHQRFHNCMLVVGATNGQLIKQIRDISPDIYFLVPGIGAQGGNLDEVIGFAGNKVVINSSRQIIFASTKEDFADIAAIEAKKLRDQINEKMGV
ncbi:MAG: orotidine-5'-phosphate decarboxylase [Calditrichaeota bacterium]|nr:orotidine-5'-phosphate decarboxylase [Calditrichota bacterium]